MSVNLQPVCLSYKEVYEYYLRVAESYRGRGLRILKTDTHNESGLWGHVSIPLAPALADGNQLTCIEINERTLNLARERFPNLDFRLGDIRTWKGEYDVILDFSTIDHVGNFESVLSNYRRLAPELSCIVWLGYAIPPRGGQFFFSPTVFGATCRALYDHCQDSLIYMEGPMLLKHFRCGPTRSGSHATSSPRAPSIPAAATQRAVLREALNYHQQGQLDQAEPLYQSLLGLQPLASQLLGALWLQQNRDLQAADLLEDFLRHGRDVGTERNLIIACKRMNRPVRGLELCDRLLGETPGDAWLNENAAHFSWAREDWQSCLNYLQRAIQAAPIRPDLACNLATVFHKLEQPAEALVWVEQCLSLNPELLEGWITQALIYRECHEMEKAKHSYARALEIDAKCLGALIGLGETAILMRDYGGACQYFHQALTLDAANVDALYGLGMAALGRREPEISREAFIRAHALAPNHKQVAGYALHTKMLCADWENLEDLRSDVEMNLAQGRLSIDPFVLMTICHDEALLRQCAENYIARFHPERPLFKAYAASASRKRLRVGYVSGEFGAHATSRLMIGLWEAHREKVDLIAFDNGQPDASALRQRIEAAFDEVVPIAHFNDEKAAHVIRSREVDVLVNLNGFFGYARTGVFARRPARVQVNYLGFPGTLGAPYIDYIFADSRVIPQGSERYFTEQVVHVGPCYQPRVVGALPAIKVERSETGLPDGVFVYCCFNKTCKITPVVWEIWMDVLATVTNSVLWLLTDTKAVAARLCRAAQTHGVSPHRLHFAPRWSHERHLARHAHADLFLDTLPCNAHTTAADALSTGLPVLTCEGKTFAGRVASSILHEARLGHWVAPDLAGYRELAINAAGPGRVRLKEDSLSLRERSQIDFSAYFDALEKVHAQGPRC